MRVALAQLNYHVGNFEQNSLKIISAIQKAKQEKADLVVFAELALCGYPARDFFEAQDFITQCQRSIERIAAECIGIAAILGAPSINPRSEGKYLFNSAYFLKEGKIESIHHKALLPNYDVFDEYRYFEPGREFKTIELNGKKLALTICEDIWDIEEDLMYTIWPMDELKSQGAELMINIAASPFSYDHEGKRKKVMVHNSTKYGMPLIYVNHVGAQTEIIFDGGSMLVDRSGKIVHEMNYFKEDLYICETNHLESKDEKRRSTKIEKIHDAIVLGIKDYFTKLGFKKAILGLSGGIDSAVTLVLAERALGKENVRTVLMPSQFSSDHSVSDSIQLVKNCGTTHQVISIEELFNTFETTMKPHFENIPFNLAEENMQARLRGNILMALSNKFGYILLNTSNKSELAVGYGTLYGDMCGGLSVIGDLYKTEVYELARYINSDKEIIPLNIIEKVPSAELRHNQKDSDSLPDYDLLDQILLLYIEGKKGPKEIIAKGFDKDLVNKILRLVNINEYKRFQAPPILRISPKAFGMGRRMPIEGKYLS